ncbi:MAG TPA: aspartate--tRNA ligase [Candidatus Omnitrophota bacterium]|nr:aspartate--tRNA ligase [Candidatus Omnitrophota bacterium]HPS20711.1 aspartate--tRNA ligase [Candidatus Omnitrophota bacterium]
MLRTHDCGELRKTDISNKVTLCGWVATRRDHGDIIFVDLRDKHGVTQIVLDPQKSKIAHEKGHEIRNEFCLKVIGIVAPRPEGTINEKLSTGEIEVDVEDIEILSKARELPFEIKDGENVSEEVRLKYRYLDLRRQSMQDKMRMKHDAYKFMNDFMDAEGFTMVETPILTKSTPEGARDYLVPSRLQEGMFYALPQSPQLFKQLLMVSGLEKYYQIARCFRDEDLRADRQPEFTQLDLEMSFIEEEDIFGVCERLFKGLFEKMGGYKLEIPFPRMTHREAMEKYGCDKPDTRFGVLLHNVTNDIAGCDFKVFNELVAAGGTITALAAPGYKDISRKDIDDLTSFVGEYGAKGLAYFKVEENELVSPITKFFKKEILDKLREKTGAKTGDMIFMVADTRQVSLAAMCALRLKIGRDKGLIKPGVFNFLWVVDFPLFQYDKEEKRWVSEHHPFTAFHEEDIEKIKSGDLADIRSRSYDLVLNGSEIGSGSIRIHRSDMQQMIFNTLGMTEEDCRVKFGFLLEAFKFGPPPHGGVAFGLDRVMTLFTGDSSIREIITFPKTQKGICPLTDAPSSVDDRQLRELGIKLRK